MHMRLLLSPISLCASTGPLPIVFVTNNNNGINNSNNNKKLNVNQIQLIDTNKQISIKLCDVSLLSFIDYFPVSSVSPM